MTDNEYYNSLIKDIDDQIARLVDELMRAQLLRRQMAEAAENGNAPTSRRTRNHSIKNKN